MPTRKSQRLDSPGRTGTPREDKRPGRHKPKRKRSSTMGCRTKRERLATPEGSSLDASALVLGACARGLGELLETPEIIHTWWLVASLEVLRSHDYTSRLNQAS